MVRVHAVGTQFTSLFRSRDLEVVRIAASYDAPYVVKDHDTVPCVSFVQQGLFQYSAGSHDAWVHSSTVLVERGDVEYTLAKPTGQHADTTIAIRLLGEEARACTNTRGQAFELRSRSARNAVTLRHLSRNVDDLPAAAVEAAAMDLLQALQERAKDRDVSDPHTLRMIERAREFMHVHHARDLRLDMIAAEACMSAFHFDRTFKRVAGITPYRYLLRVRTAEARRLLLQGAGSTECAYLTGFSSPSHFTNTFRALEGVAPGLFAKRNILQVRA
jgi:AraC-like DNA-binding protein